MEVGEPSRRTLTSSVGTLRHHPAVKFLITGALSLAVDMTTLKLLHGVVHLALAPSTVAAFAAAFVVNFTGARQWVFGDDARAGRAKRQLLRYLILVGLNLASTLVIVVGLSSVGLEYLLAKAVAVAINGCGNFFAFRYWVFRKEPIPL